MSLVVVIMELRSRPSSSTSYSADESVYTVGSASKWREDTTQHMRIKVVDVQDMFPSINLPSEAMSLVIPEWNNSQWLMSVDIKSSPYDNKIKTLIQKIRNVCIASISMTAFSCRSSKYEKFECNLKYERLRVIVDGFMDSLLHILCFDDYPCFLYPQYNYSAHIGRNNRTINAKSDFSVLSEENKIMLVIEDKTVTSATYANNWKEDQVMGELFVAVHNFVSKSNNVEYPVNIYAVRVIGTLFTFYKTVATLDYIKESARLGMSVHNDMVVQRHPFVEDNPSKLTAYDICRSEDRTHILRCLCSIRKFITV